MSVAMSDLLSCEAAPSWWALVWIVCQGDGWGPAICNILVMWVRAAVYKAVSLVDIYQDISFESGTGRKGITSN